MIVIEVSFVAHDMVTLCYYFIVVKKKAYCLFLRYKVQYMYIINLPYNSVLYLHCSYPYFCPLDLLRTEKGELNSCMMTVFLLLLTISLAFPL